MTLFLKSRMIANGFLISDCKHTCHDPHIGLICNSSDCDEPMEPFESQAMVIVNVKGTWMAITGHAFL